MFQFFMHVKCQKYLVKCILIRLQKCFDLIVVQFKMQISFEKFAHHLVIPSFFQVEKVQMRQKISFKKKLMSWILITEWIQQNILSRTEFILSQANKKVTSIT